ncbi:MAG: 5'/3'-nucleotidase SurE [Erysipelotrichales bacterium]|nr:5'/3'-nucleotidase SurE [Erysipelotrichales bacterium]
MKIFLCNDDGIDSEGLRALADVFSKEHDVYIAAPKVQQSGAGHSMTIFRDVTAEKREYPGAKEAYAIDGTPADCAYLGLLYLVKEKPDVVISGINWGDNMSSDCITSGTVGGALEGLLQGYPSMAVSVTRPEKGKFTYPAGLAAKLLPYYLNDPECGNYVFNLNVPCGDPDTVKGLKVTRFDGIRVYNIEFETIQNGNTTTFRVRPAMTKSLRNAQGTLENDVTADDAGYATVTPISWDMVVKKSVTDLKYLEDLTL